jgi:acyl transferase domain-containing protein
LFALANVMGENRDEAHPLVMLALKANIGHLEGAAGMTSLNLEDEQSHGNESNSYSDQ